MSIEDVLDDPLKTIDPKRRSRKYAELVAGIKQRPHLKLTEIFEVVADSRDAKGKPVRKKDEASYQYVEIDNIGAGEFRPVTMRGWQLPQRAKHFAAPLDVYIGSIWSSVSKWCLIHEVAGPNVVVTNGWHRLKLRPGKEMYLIDAAAFFCTESYRTQMRALARGSDGLAEIHDSDLDEVLVPLVEDERHRAALKPYLEALKGGLPTLRIQVAAMMAAGSLPFPAPAERPHHSVLV